MRELFIYFRAAVADEARVGLEIHALQQALRRAWPGLAARCLRRPDPQDGLHTWMETYAAGTATGVDAAVEASISEAAQTRLAPLIVGARHVEAFIPLPA